MRYYEATSMIAASPEAVWAVLSDGASWAAWDSGVDAVDGRMAPGESIKIRTQAAPGRSFPVKVTTFDPPVELRLRGGMPLGMFRGERTYLLAPDASGRTTFHVREEYTGPLVGLIWRSMPDLGPSFEKFAQGLKQRVESGG
jgi:uncharacterized protein YndB with AHSA1/START domain